MEVNFICFFNEEFMENVFKEIKNIDIFKVYNVFYIIDVEVFEFL